MPPQPITRIISNPTVDFDPAKLATVPHLTALPMAVIAIWGAIDGNLAKMLSHIVGSDFAIVVAMLHALKSQDSQRSAIFGAAEKALHSDDYNLLKAVDKVTKASRARRHEYAHHLWGIPNVSDALALLDPRDGLKEIVAFEKRMEEWKAHIEAEQALLWFLDLQRALFGPSPQAKDEARQRLLTAPQIAQALQPQYDEKYGSPPE
jgi:hypothetical protein